MSDRKPYLAGAKRLVVKIGSAVLTQNGGLRESAIEALSRQVAACVKGGVNVAVVSSGAIAAGRGKLGLKDKPKTIPLKQAAAAAGQAVLMHHYEKAFSSLGLKTAQVLLTAADLVDRQRFLNARNTLLTLLELGVIPIINENDTVAVEEIKFGDNDRLSALVSNLVDADLLVILTDTDGFYDSDPRENKAAKKYDFLETLTDAHFDQAGGTKTDVGSGGMVTKLEAARQAALQGTSTVITAGAAKDVLEKILSDEPVGTFIAGKKAIGSRKHWIAYTLSPKGALVLDDGACEALSKKGKSLLPSGIREVQGQFGAGEAVRCLSSSGKEIARGLASYSSEDIRRIAGKKTSEIEKILGYKYYDEVIHRDDLVLLEEGS